MGPWQDRPGPRGCGWYTRALVHLGRVLCPGSPSPHEAAVFITGPDVLCWVFFSPLLLAILEKSFFTYYSGLNFTGCVCRKLLDATSFHMSLSACCLPRRGQGTFTNSSAAAGENSAASALACLAPFICILWKPGGHHFIQSREEFLIKYILVSLVET